MNNMPEPQNGPFHVNRRDFVKNSSFAAAMLAMGGVPLFAQDQKEGQPPALDANAVASPIKVGVIGIGEHGRALLTRLSTEKRADVIAVCDDYGVSLNRGKKAAPKSEGYTDYKKLLENKDLQAVIVATPSHKHKNIVLDAFAAGKHVYCEAPMATTIDDARAIASAAKDNPKLNFQVGQMYRCSKHHQFVLSFIRSGATGNIAVARAQWHKKQTWRRNAPNAEREKELNWRLNKEVSLGLVGEVGVQQIDSVNWILGKRPVAVTGIGRVALHNDGRDVDDTVQAVYEYADGTFFTFEATLANSFDSDYEMVYGSDAAVMMRGSRAWLFKETDSPLLGWEVYARKEAILNETGIVLMADASKSTPQNEGGAPPPPPDPLQYTLETFLKNTELVSNAVEDYSASFDVNDKKALAEYLGTVRVPSAGYLPAAGYLEGYQAAVSVIKGAEAVAGRQRVKIEKDLFQI